VVGRQNADTANTLQLRDVATDVAVTTTVWLSMFSTCPYNMANLGRLRSVDEFGAP